MADYSNFTVEQLRKRRDWLQKKGWDSIVEEIEQELAERTRDPTEMTEAELKASGWEVAHLAKPGTLEVKDQ